MLSAELHENDLLLLYQWMVEEVATPLQAQSS